MRIRYLIYCCMIFLLNHVYGQSDTLRLESIATTDDSVEYELLVLDPGFETFLAMQPDKEFYSQSYYENWNNRYVIEWNSRHAQPMVYGEEYETYIDYRSNIDYGLELNYKLYYYFKFFEKEHNLKLLSL